MRTYIEQQFVSYLTDSKVEQLQQLTSQREAPLCLVAQYSQIGSSIAKKWMKKFDWSNVCGA